MNEKKIEEALEELFQEIEELKHEIALLKKEGREEQIKNNMLRR